MLTTAELQAIRTAMTWGDQAYGKEQAGDDSAAMITYAMFRSAKRLGLTAPDSTLDEFLDSVRMDDLNDALEAERAPTSAATGT